MTTLALPSSALRAFAMALLLLPALRTKGQTCSISYSPSASICANAPVTFTGTTSLPLDSVFFQWNFGDGSPVAIGNPVTHSYPFNAANSTYTVTLTIFDNTQFPFNDTCVVTQVLTVNYTPQLTVTGVSEFCQPNLACTDSFTTTFTLTAGTGLGPFTWDFGDGSPLVTSPALSQTHTYSFGTHILNVTAAGAQCPGFTLPVRYYTQPKNPVLNAPSTFKCEGDTIFVSNASLDCPGNIDNYLIYWSDFVNFNNPGPGPADTFNVGGQAYHIYSFDANVLCGNSAGSPLDDNYFFQPTIGLVSQSYYYQCGPPPAPPQWIAGPVNISPVPKPSYTFPNNCYCFPGNSTVTFSPRVCPAPRSTFPIQYTWNFGDPASGASNIITATATTNNNNLPQVSHTFSGPGIYQVSLTVDNTLDDCGISTIVNTVIIRSVPVPAISTPVSEGCAPLAVPYTNATTAIGGFNTVWSVSPSTGVVIGGGPSNPSPTITFNSPGTYFVQATVSNCCGGNIFRDTIIVQAPPSVTIAPIPDGCGPQTLAPSAVVNANGSPITAYSWNFGPNAAPLSSSSLVPGSVSFTPVASTPPAPTAFNITLSATNACGTATDSEPFQLVASPNLSAGADDTTCSGQQICLPGTPAGGTWQQVPGGPSNASGCFTFAAAGTYTLEYRIAVLSCTFRDTVRVTVPPLDNVDAGPNASLCAGDTLVLQGLPAGGTWSGSAALSVAGGNVLFAPTTPAPGGASQNVTLTYAYTNPLTGCAQSDTRVITVHSRPLVSIAQPSLSLCVSNSPQSLPALLNESPLGGTWSVPGGSFTPSVAGTFMVYYSFTNANGCSARDSVQIIVSEPTPTDAGPGDTVCVNAQAFLLTGGTPPGGSWSGPGVSLGGFFNPAAAGVGAQVVTYSTGTGTCLRQDTRTITVLPAPVVDAGPNASLCAGDTLVLSPLVSGSAGGNGQWTASPSVYNAFIVNGNSFLPPASSPAATLTLTYTYTDTSAAVFCTVSDSRVITLCPLPLVDIAEDTLFLCFSPQVQSLPGLVSESPAGGIWAGPGVVNAATGSFNPSLAGLGSHVITYTSLPTPCGCVNSSSFVIQVQNPVPALAGPNDTLCRNEAPLTLAGAPGGGQWEDLSGGTLSASNVLIFNPLNAPLSSSFVYVIFEGSSCEQRDTLQVVVNDTAALAMGPLQRACADAPLQTLSGYTPAGGLWSHPLPGLVTPGGQVSPGLLPPNTTANLLYTFANAAGCTSLGVKPFRTDSLPLVNIFPTDTTYCQTNLLQPLPSRTPAGGAWNGPGVVSGQYLPATPGSFTLVYSYVNSLGCDALDSVAVTVVPPVPALAGPDTALCANSPLYSRAGLPAGGYWRQIGSAFSTANNLLIFNPQAFTPGAYAFEYIIFEGTSCEQRDTALLTVLALPMLSALPDSACFTSLPLVLTQGYVNGVQTAGDWFGPGVQAAGGTFSYAGPPGSPLPYTETLFYSYTLAYPAFSTGCRDTVSGSVTVMPQPTLSINSLPDNCVNALVAFSASLNGPFPAASYLWGFGDGGTSVLPAPLHAYADTGSFAVSLLVSTAFGCADTLGSSIFISEPPQAQFAASVDTGCAIRNVLPPLPVFAGVPDAAGLAISFADQSVAAGGSYFWDFGGGFDASGSGTSSQASPPLIYFAQDSTVASYIVSLSIANYCDTVIYQDTIVVNPLPQVLFGPSGASSGCSIFPVNFISLTQGSPTSFAWYADGQLFSTQPLPPPQFYSYNGTGDTTYLIQLIAENACGSDTGFHEITVFPNTVDPSFNVSLSQACPGQAIRLINLSAAPNSGNFSMGDGTSYANADTVFHSYAAPGTYQIAHYVDNGCSYDTAYFTVNVFADTALIQPSDSLVCPGEPISFQVLPSGSVSGPVWDFGDGTGDSSSLSPVHIYYQPGSYTVSLGGTTTLNGCPVAASVQVQVAPSPAASIQASVQAGCLGANGLTVNFAATPQLPGALYLWSFGDGNFGAGASLSHTYADTGFHEVLLLVSAPGQFACPGADTLRVYVRPNPEAAFSFSLSDSCGGPSTALFTNLSTDTLVSYLWNFGTGAPSTASNPVFVYPSFGVYPISLTVTDLYNCQAVALDTAVVYEQPSAAFQATPGQGCEPLDVQITPQATGFSDLVWDLGNGLTSTATQPFIQSYTSPNQPITQYLITLVAVNAGLCFDTAQAVVGVSSLPLSDFSASADTVCGAPATITFQEQASDLGAILSYAWNFGDPASGAQNTSAQANPSHLYAAPGLYSVTLVVTNDRGCRDTAVRQVLILAQPLAQISADRTTGCFDRPFLLENIQPDNATGRRWELCDGRVFSGPIAAIPFSLPDTCQVVLIAENSGFCFARDSITLRVGAPPVSDFAMQVLGECADTVEVYLENNSLFADQYRWDFGDGRFSTEFEPLIFYTFPDDYLVTLIARNAFGCEDTSSQTVEYLRSIADFDFGPRRGCEDLQVQFSDASTQVTEWTWDFGDGSPLSFDSMPSHTYTRAGQFFVTLYVSYQGLCRDTFRHPVPVEVLESPVAAFEALKTGRPGEFEFRDVSPVRGDTLFWDFGDGSGSSAERNPVYQYMRYDTVLVTMIARNLNGCADTARDTLQNGAYGLWIPNVMHPGAGGADDLFTQFKPVGIGLAEFEIAVYNKYGNIVWASSALDGEGAPAEAWDGRINGSLTTMDVFGWKVLKARFRDGAEWNGPREGSVTVLR